jgi:glycosyltransferase involved in cell wall biosynthesis
MRVHFVAPGGLVAATGGNIYDRMIIDGLLARGLDVSSGEEPRSDATTVLDSLAFPNGVPEGSFVALVHQLPSEARAAPPQDEREALAKATRVVTVAHWLQERLIAKWDVSSVVIPPGRDRAWARESDGTRDIVLVVGNATVEKRIDLAIEAFREADTGLDLIIAGDLAVERGARARRALASTPRAHAVGVLVPAALSALYARARVLLTASLYEGRSIAVTEAMASAVPIVGFDVPGMRELVRTGVDGWLVPEGDVHSLSERLRTTVADPTMAASMSLSARERALKWPTWDQSCRSFLTELERLPSMAPR